MPAHTVRKGEAIDDPSYREPTNYGLKGGVLSSKKSAVARRPLAGPPIFSYDEIIEEVTESLKQMKVHPKKFHPNKSVRTQHLDIEIEERLLRLYSDWVDDMYHEAEGKDVLPCLALRPGQGPQASGGRGAYAFCKGALWRTGRGRWAEEVDWRCFCTSCGYHDSEDW